jgi:predicted phosphodiesterase
VRFGILTDAHANLPALTAALEALNAERCDFIVHTGDAIGIGPHPAECLDRLLAGGVELVMGNHDSYFAFGLKGWPYSEGELAHQRWVHEQIDPSLRAVVATWPWQVAREVNGQIVLFTHYGRDGDGPMSPLDQDSTIADLDSRWAYPGRRTTIPDLDSMFSESEADIVFFGHDHQPLDGVGSRRYVNPGSLGCNLIPEARAAIAEFGGGAVHVRHLAVGYDDASVFEDLEARDVPDREQIRRLFLSRADDRELQT